MARFRETLRRLAVFDERLVAAGSGLDPAGTPALDAKTAALLQVGVSVATGSSAVCLQWSATRALAAGATEDEIADVLVAIASVAGLGRIAREAVRHDFPVNVLCWGGLDAGTRPPPHGNAGP